MRDKKITEVVAALIWEDGRFMICQRPAHKARGLLWEFVGGKTEYGETKEQALIRECREELDVEISVGDVFYEVVHAYPDLTVRLTLFSAKIVRGEPKLLEHADIRWIHPSEISRFDFCPADEEILRKIREVYHDRIIECVREKLFELQDLSYRDFHSKLMPTVDPVKIIGVRIPQLRKLAKEFAKYSDAEEFLQSLPHYYYEENNLHAFLLESMGDYETAMYLTEQFLPYIDNWATCDGMNPKIFGKNLPSLKEKILEWIASDHVYTIRFGIGMLMRYYLEDDTFSQEVLRIVAEIRSEEYYVNMMIAWFFATALAKQYDVALPVLKEKKLEIWTHNKTIQKAVESYRIDPERKAYLRTLRRK